jgi:hypothetical protein
MLCFNYTVGFPLSATVLSQLFHASRTTRVAPRLPRPSELPHTGSDSRKAIKPPVASTISSQGPTSPTLRANPFPEVTDPFCRLPLPTFFYQLEAANLGDLMRL